MRLSLLWPFLASFPLAALAAEGVVVDEATGRTVAGATIVQDGAVYHSGFDGRFLTPQEGRLLSARAPSYRRRDVPVEPGAPMRIALQSVTPKAIYLSPYGIADGKLRGAALDLLAHTELNALVIDMKGDASVLPHASAAWQAAELGEQHPTAHDLGTLLRALHERQIYLIARIVVFKDDRFVRRHPQFAVRTAQGAIWHDREGLAWIDPSHREAWSFALDVADEAAQLGFDEIQFDYMRFPDATGLRFSIPETEAARVQTIGAFLDAARERLARYNVFIAADVFGYVCWNKDDTGIGQKLEVLAPKLDYLSPMLYPSGFTFGIPDHRDPVAAPYEIVRASLARALERTGMPAKRLRPWLQAFRDYAFDRREFGAEQVRAQIDAAEALGTDGWMLWNAGNHYAPGGLRGTGAPP
jgi:hypothetical protein